MLLAACSATTGCDLVGDRDGGGQAQRGLRLHPDNPRYLQYRGKPTVLITSGEHYGAVVNADFDYQRYLDALAKDGFNLTRLFSGSYIQEEFPPNTRVLGYNDPLAVRPGRLVAPWARANGRFDLARWNEAYFERLKSFLGEARKRGIVVELVLFSALYDRPIWQASPFNAENNVNRVGAIEPSRLYTLDNGGVLELQDALVRKLVAEVRGFDNLYFEVINEGWEEPTVASDRWQDHIIRTIEDAESELPQPHLIARNYPHDERRISDPHPSVSIFNFHYQRDVSRYGNLEGVISFDETGFQGTADRPYRTDAWYFLLSGGGVYSNLDWSFAPGREDGSFEPPAGTPGGGGPSLRRSLAVLKRFLERFDLPQMSPSHELVTRSPPGAITRALADPGRSYAIYVSGGRAGPLVLDLAEGRYRAEWVDTRTGSVAKSELLELAGLETRLTPPAYDEDIALAIEAAQPGQR